MENMLHSLRKRCILNANKRSKNGTEAVHMKNENQIRIIIQMVRRVHREEFLTKIYTYVKTLLELQGD